MQHVHPHSLVMLLSWRHTHLSLAFLVIFPGTMRQVYERSRTLGQTAREGRLQYLYQEGIT